MPSLADWTALISSAIMQHPETNDPVQDNSRLPEIVVGIEQLFGQDTSSALVVKTILFHSSLDVLKEYPQGASLTQHEIRHYLGGKLLPLLEVMMLVDNDAWAFFNSDMKQRHRAETLAVFENVRQLFRIA